MNWTLSWMFAATLVWLLVWGFLRPERMYQFPFLAAAMGFSFLLPQVPALAADPFLPPDAFAKTIFFTILCLIACRVGWSQNARPLAFLNGRYRERHLLVVAAGFCVIGAYFYYQLSRLPGDLIIGVQVSGAPVIYIFFSRLLSYGLAIALLCFARRPSYEALAIVVFGMIFYLDRIIITGKRAEAMELVLMVLLAFWFHHRVIVPRIVVLVGLLAGTVLMTSTSDFRDITRVNASAAGWDELARIDVWHNFMDQLEYGGPEMRNAVLRIDTAEKVGNYDFGLFHWNTLVFNYVPAQIFGPELKEALRASLPKEIRGYDPATGSTETGMADAFQSFWYFGFIKFLVLSMIVCRIWKTAMVGEFGGQLLYIFSAVPAMHAISHHTDWIIMVWVHMALFLGPVLLFIRRRPLHGTRRLEMATP